jgi:hypothetical protein
VEEKGIGRSKGSRGTYLMLPKGSRRYVPLLLFKKIQEYGKIEYGYTVKTCNFVRPWYRNEKGREIHL